MSIFWHCHVAKAESANLHSRCWSGESSSSPPRCNVGSIGKRTTTPHELAQAQAIRAFLFSLRCYIVGLCRCFDVGQPPSKCSETDCKTAGPLGRCCQTLPHAYVVSFVILEKSVSAHVPSQLLRRSPGWFCNGSASGSCRAHCIPEHENVCKHWPRSRPTLSNYHCHLRSIACRRVVCPRGCYCLWNHLVCPAG